jgi:hypothetical protein
MAEQAKSGTARWLMLAILLVVLLAAGHFGLAHVAGIRRARLAAAPPAPPSLRYGADARDVPGVPAPPLSKIQFSAASARPRKEMAVYTCGAEVSSVEAYYRQMMPAGGWELVRRTELPSPDQPGMLMRFQDRKKGWCMVLISRFTDTELTVTTFRTEASEPDAGDLTAWPGRS